MKTTTSPKDLLQSSGNLLELEPDQILALLDGPIDEAAVRFLAFGAGLLRLHDDYERDLDGALRAMRGADTDAEHFIHFVDQDYKAGSGDIGDRLYPLLMKREAQAYLFGLAVGRRLGPQAFTTKGGAR